MQYRRDPCEIKHFPTPANVLGFTDRLTDFEAEYCKIVFFSAVILISTAAPGVVCLHRYNQATMESTWDKPAVIDLYFKKPVVPKSLLYLGETTSSGLGMKRSSIVNGFERG